MPAYKRRLYDPDCQEPGCPRRATFKVFNSFNATMGGYCGPHANALVAKLNEPASSVFRKKPRPGV